MVAESNSNGRGGGVMIDVHGIYMRTTLKSAVDAQHVRTRLFSDLPRSNVFCCEILLPIQPERWCSQRVFC